MVNFIPAGNRVLIKPKEVETQSAGGILLPDEAQEKKPLQGSIVATNEGIRKVGEKVLFSRYGIDEVIVDEENYIVVSEDFILGNFTT